MVFSENSVKERVKKLEEVLNELNEKKDISLNEYEDEIETQWIIERGLEIASSLILDIGNHILAGVYSVSPENYEEILKQLKNKEIISRTLYEQLRGLGGFRNILVHGYMKINSALVFSHFRQALDSFPAFIVEINNWLDRFADQSE